MVYYTSDLHLGHANAIAFTNRPFTSVEEMDRVLIDNINRTLQINEHIISSVRRRCLIIA